MKKNNSTLIARAIVRVILILATLVALAFGTIKIVPVAWKVTGTQLKMAWFYIDLTFSDGSEKEHAGRAKSWTGVYSSEAVKSEQNMADAAVENYNSTYNARKALQADSDPIVRWAAKNQFELPVLLLGLAMFAGIGATWALCLKKRFTIIQYEELALAFILYGVCAIFTVFVGLFQGFAAFIDYDCAELKKVNDAAKSNKARHHKRRSGSKVVPMQKRKVG